MLHPPLFFFFLENSKDEGGGGDGNVASLIVERKASKPVAGFAASLLSRGALLFGSAYRRPTLATAAAAAVRTPRRLLLSFWFWDFDFLLQCCVFKPVRVCLLCDQPFQLVVDGVVPVLGM